MVQLLWEIVVFPKKVQNYCMIWQSCFPGASEVKAPASNAGDPGLIPGSGRSPGEGNGNPLQYSCLENPMDREAWQATVHRVTKSRTRLSDFTFTFTLAILLLCVCNRIQSRISERDVHTYVHCSIITITKKWKQLKYPLKNYKDGKCNVIQLLLQ